MVRKQVVSTFEYDVIPFAQQDLAAPVVVIMETNDGYHVVLDFAGYKNTLKASNTSELRGGTEVTEYSSFREYILTEFSGYLEDDDDASPKNETDIIALITDMPAEFDSIMTGPDAAADQPKVVLRVTALTGSYRDPDALMDYFFNTDNEDEEDDE